MPLATRKARSRNDSKKGMKNASTQSGPVQGQKKAKKAAKNKRNASALQQRSKKAVRKLRQLETFSIAGDIRSKEIAGCIPPSNITINLDFERSWGRAIDIIDAFIRVAQLTKPGNFVRLVGTPNTTGPNNPTIRANMLRALWLAGVRQYWYNLGIIAGNSANSIVKVPSVTLPHGLAKFVQQFAPYVDSTTGTQYQFLIQPYGDNVNVFANYPDISVASSTGTIATNLQFFRFWYHLHPSDFATSSRTNDIGTSSAANNPLYANDGVVTSWTTYIQGVPQTELAAINALFPGISPERMPKFASDASAYTVITSTGVTSPCPIFEPLMSIICGYYQANGGENDLDSAYPYVKPLTAVRYNKQTGFVDYSTGYRITLYNLYATISSQVTRFEPMSTSLSQLKHTECYGGVRTWSYTGVKVNQFMIAERLSEYMDILDKNDATSTDTNATTLFSLSIMFWSAVLKRISMYDAILDTKNVYRGFAFGDGLPSLQLPITLARTAAGIGPVIQNGKLYFPYLYEDMQPWVFRIATTAPYNWSMTSTLITGFNVSATCYQPTATQSTTLALADGSAIIPNTAVRYTFFPYKLFKYFLNTSRILRGFNANRALQLPETCLGTPSKIFGIAVAAPATADYGSTNTLVQAYERAWLANITSCFHLICATGMDSMDTLYFGLCAQFNQNAPVQRPLTTLATTLADSGASQVAQQTEGDKTDGTLSMIQALQQQNDNVKAPISTTKLDFMQPKKSSATPYQNGQPGLIVKLGEQMDRMTATVSPNYENIRLFSNAMLQYHLSRPSTLPASISQAGGQLALAGQAKQTALIAKTITTVGQNPVGRVSAHSNHGLGGFWKSALNVAGIVAPLIAAVV